MGTHEEPLSGRRRRLPTTTRSQARWDVRAAKTAFKEPSSDGGARAAVYEKRREG